MGTPRQANNTSFKPGKCPNPGGVPKGMTRADHRDQIALAKGKFHALLPKAFYVLEQMFKAENVGKNGKKKPDLATREIAMNIVFNRALGMVVEKKEISGADGAPIQLQDNTPAIRLLLQQALPDTLTLEAEKE
jgi:hypothetical protein